MVATTCLSPHDISSYLLGRLPPPAIDEIASHLEECPDCQARAESLDADGDSLIARLRDPGPTTWEPSDVAPEPLLDRVRRLPSICEPPDRIRDYLLLEEIGRGGMGVVYRARHERLSREVALKLLRPESAGRAGAEVRFEREMKTIGQLQDAHIVAALDAGVDDGTYYLAMEFISGCDASALLERHGPLRVADACEIVRQAALGLAHAHQQGVLHRDIKPSNLLITRAGIVKIADLGLARFSQAENEGEQSSVGVVSGTLHYLSPEQAAGSHASQQSDLYSLGVSLFKLLTGKSPLAVGPQATAAQVLLALQSGAAPPVRSLRPEVPKPLETLVARLLEKEPANRPTSAGEIATALEPYCEGANLARLLADPTDLHAAEAMAIPAAAIRATTLSKRAGWFAAAATLVVVVGIVSAALFQPGDDKPQQPAGQAAVNDQASQQGAKQAAEQQTAWAEKLKAPVHQMNSLGMGLTLIPPGEFLMGSSALEVQQAVAIERREVPEGWPMWYFVRKVEAEAPAHRVKLTRPFLMGTHEVTVAEWDAFEKATNYRRIALREPDHYGKEGFGRDEAKWDAALPMAYVSWDDAKAFCSWLSMKEKKTYRLPTEAEWEYACRAGTTTSWFTGNDVESLRDYAWTLQTCGVARPAERNDAPVRPEKVGTKKPNPFGLHDMTGNVWEWCGDYFHQGYYAQSPAEDPPGPHPLAEKQHPGTVVVRGGANGFRENESRSATRWFLKPHAPAPYRGFRVVCELSDKPTE